MRPALFRARDVVVSLAGLVMLLPLFGIVGAAIKVDTSGPAFYRQERVGRNGELFRIRKFRSMVHNGTGLAISCSDDERITRVGRILRQSKIDELPQLLDVLIGHMSLVGPRPEVLKYVAVWPPEARRIILSVRPGITDPASVQFRHEGELLRDATDAECLYVNEILPLKVAAYVRYVQNRSLTGDCFILARTLRAIISPSKVRG